MPNRFEQPAFYLQSGDPETENAPTLAYPGQLGVRFTVIQPSRSTAGVESGRSKRYQLIRSDSTMTVAPAATSLVPRRMSIKHSPSARPTRRL